MKKSKKTIIGISAAVVGAVAVTTGIRSFAASTSDAPVAITCSNGTITTQGEGVTVDKETITITEAGYYSISGTISDGQIIVEADDDTAEVEVELSGLDAKCSYGPVFYVKSADKTILSAKKDTINTLTDASSYELADGEDEPNACVYAKDDLKVQGKGTLNINANYMHGINCKDDLNVKNLTLNVVAKEDGIRGKDSLEIKSGVISVNAQDDAIISYNDEDAEEGYLAISDGTITIDCRDDAVKGEYYVTISETAVINVKSCYEGIEAPTINLEGGEVKIYASDDGINASDGSSSDTQGGMMPGGQGGMSAENGIINISGGSYYVNASGDGIDANGSISMSGGIVYVDGPTDNGNGALDYDGQFALTGGTFVAAGSSGMAQAPTADVSTQYSVSATFDANISGAIVVKDSSNNEIINYIPAKSYQNVVLSVPEFSANSSYTLNAGSNSTQFTLSSIVTTVGNAGNGGGSFNPFRTRVPFMTMQPATNVTVATLTPVTTQPASESNSVTIYYKSSWSNTYIHYQIGSGEWTSVPGIAMNTSLASGYYTTTINLGSESSITCCFNDGSNNWDNNNSSNYVINSGVYTINNKIVNSGAPVGATVEPTISATTSPVVTSLPNKTTAPTTIPPSTGKVIIYYYTGWTDAYIHYQIGSGSWTQVPGVKMQTSEYSGYKYAEVSLGTEDKMKCCFNNGNGNWDNNSGNDYSLSSGVYMIINGKITKSVPSETVAAENTITIYYYTSWSKAYIHYQTGSNGWTSVPGVVMSDSDISGYKAITIDLGSSSSLKACFNNGSGSWDNNSSNDYSFSSAGTYTVKDGTVINFAP